MEERLAQLIEQLDEAMLWSESRVLERGDLLTVPGSTNSDMFFIEEGSLRIYIIDDAQEHNIRFAYKHNFITALDSYISGEATQFYIQAIKKTRIRSLSKSSFEDFMRSDPQRMQAWHLMMQQLVYQQLEREVDLLTQSPKERYKRVLKRSPQLFQEIPARHIASYLRMTPETLSRLKKS